MQVFLSVLLGNHTSFESYLLTLCQGADSFGSFEPQLASLYILPTKTDECLVQALLDCEAPECNLK